MIHYSGYGGAVYKLSKKSILQLPFKTNSTMRRTGINGAEKRKSQKKSGGRDQKVRSQKIQGNNFFITLQKQQKREW